MLLYEILSKHSLPCRELSRKSNVVRYGYTGLNGLTEDQGFLEERHKRLYSGSQGDPAANRKAFLTWRPPIEKASNYSNYGFSAWEFSELLMN